MTGVYQDIHIDDLINYSDNPRHTIGMNEEDTLKKLFAAVGVQYMFNLAKDIQEHGLIGSQHVVVVYSEAINKYIVYEGNRRIAAIKLLLDPDRFNFLDNSTIDKIKKIRQEDNIPTTINCYITDEEDAFFIMERTHSGEDKGRGTKEWNSWEKENFKVRRNHEKSLSYLIDFYVKKYFDGLDITTILPFTTIQRIFNNREIKKAIGLDISNEKTFTAARIKLIVDASNWILQEAQNSGTSVTRLFNKSRVIEDTLLPWIRKYNSDGLAITQQPTFGKLPIPNKNMMPPVSADNKNISNKPLELSPITHQSPDKPGIISEVNQADKASGGKNNLSYFFQGLKYGMLNPNDPDTHGVSAVCRELQLFSNKKMVSEFPLSAAFLTRSIIEQAIIYYSKKHYIQGQNRLIYDKIKSFDKLSKIVENYNRNLPNYITDRKARDYFTSLFHDYKSHIDPLNWVIHRPSEFRLPPQTLIDLPNKGLLSLINFMIS